MRISDWSSDVCSSDLVAEFDALFIRETTAVNHHTYRFARRAAREGLVVVDDPLSILRAANKVFLAQLMERHRLPQPKTVLLHPRNVKIVGRELGFPCVLHKPARSEERRVGQEVVSPCRSR